MSSYLYQKIIIIPAILIAFVAQGYARAKMADKLGDKTPRFQGRLSLNPLDHIDLMGFLMIILTGFGWTKPVETNPSAFKRGYKDEIKVTLAGILVNLLVAFITMFILLLWGNFSIRVLPYSIANIGYEMLWNISLININLFVFNLLPIPGLAGFDLFREISPKNFYRYGSKLYEYQIVILLAIVLLGSYILKYPVVLIFSLFAKIAGLILGIFI
ncbi:site-2 protease family protein [Clostridium sp. Sa3CUN1]|uniref:Site-2 protease family protein n=1 Tax=Clostridium gallinarum TaxID=2762246 RepID=A0ABR8Q0V5_9CLOT|nr:site-2 protease family protein [Clostridium gallinarum]MBD7914053.1 site-2 protease family protein [Clostridium gallinarum]